VNLKEQKFNKGKIVIYQTSKKEVELKVRLEKETVWLTQGQIAILFGIQRPAITKHLNNIFKSGELNKNSVSSILERTAKDGKIYKIQFYNLDAVISVGYRVNSKRATQFRIWASRILKNYLIKGYALNEQRLTQAQDRFNDLQNTISFLQEKSKHELLSGQEQEILNLLSNYSKTLTLLEQYDKETLAVSRQTKDKFVLSYDASRIIITELKKGLMAKKEAGDLFGQEYENKFKAIFGNVYQAFDGKALYGSLEEKAAHFLYFIIKDHPFADGNKRIGAFCLCIFWTEITFFTKKAGRKRSMTMLLPRSHF